MKIKGIYELRDHLDQSGINPESAGGQKVQSFTTVDMIHLIIEEIEFADPSELSAVKECIIEHFNQHPFFDIAESDIVFEVTE